MRQRRPVTRARSRGFRTAASTTTVPRPCRAGVAAGDLSGLHAVNHGRDSDEPSGSCSSVNTRAITSSSGCGDSRLSSSLSCSLSRSLLAPDQLGPSGAKAQRESLSSAAHDRLVVNSSAAIGRREGSSGRAQGAAPITRHDLEHAHDAAAEARTSGLSSAIHTTASSSTRRRRSGGGRADRLVVNSSAAIGRREGSSGRAQGAAPITSHDLEHDGAPRGWGGAAGAALEASRQR
jgi:hypothetical protein